MNLSQGDERPQLLAAGGAELHQERRSIAFDCAARVLFGESEIERLSPVDAGKTSGSRAETVNQPGNPNQRLGLQDRESRFVELLSHQPILTDDSSDAAPGYPGTVLIRL
jgi:hypothetical protein